MDGLAPKVAVEAEAMLELNVRGLVPNRAYGAHVHAKPYGAKGDDAGPHCQCLPNPVGPSVDPAYPNTARTTLSFAGS